MYQPDFGVWQGTGGFHTFIHSGYWLHLFGTPGAPYRSYILSAAQEVGGFIPFIHAKRGPEFFMYVVHRYIRRPLYLRHFFSLGVHEDHATKIDQKPWLKSNHHQCKINENEAKSVKIDQTPMKRNAWIVKRSPRIKSMSGRTAAANSRCLPFPLAGAHGESWCIFFF